MTRRCAWADRSPLMRRYHDREWGVPVREDRKLFEFLVLEGMQAGLSWLTILRKRDGYRRAFDGFDIVKVAAYGDAKTASLLEDPGIVRNRLKVASTVANAQAVIAIQEEFGSFDAFIWGFVGGGGTQGPDLITKMIWPGPESHFMGRVDINLLQRQGQVHQRTQVHVGVAVAGGPNHAFWAAPSGKPDGRMGFLHG